jgi:hypothetical protein
VYVLVAIVRKRLGLEASLYHILQILSLTLFEKTPILCTLQSVVLDSNFTEDGYPLHSGNPKMLWFRFDFAESLPKSFVIR